MDNPHCDLPYWWIEVYNQSFFIKEWPYYTQLICTEVGPAVRWSSWPDV